MGKQAAQNVPNITLQDLNEAVFQLLRSSHRNEYPFMQLSSVTIQSHIHRLSII